MDGGRIGVTGATGGLGGRLARRLADHGVPQRLLVRDAARAPDLEHAEVATFGGYDDAERRPPRAGGHRHPVPRLGRRGPRPRRAAPRRVDAVVAAGVRRIVYTSFLGAAPDCTFTFGRDHFHTEEHIKATASATRSCATTSTSTSSPRWLGADGVIRGPAGDGRVAAVARDDIADVAVQCCRRGPRRADVRPHRRGGLHPRRGGGGAVARVAGR